MSAEHWKKVPAWMDAPALVFDSATVPGRLVFFAPEQLNGEPIVMIIDPAADKKGVTVNLLVNAYDKGGGKIPFRRWIDGESRNGGCYGTTTKQKAPRSGTFCTSIVQSGPSAELERKDISGC
nr:hypothetical protein [Nitrosospira multiformis]